MIQRTLFVALFSLLLNFSYAQQPVYATKENLMYYPEAVCKANSYIAERCKLDVYYPKNKTNSPAIVWFHGGGLTGGNKEIPKALMEQGFIVVGVGYRLAPKAAVNDIIEDAAAAVAWIFQHVQEYGGSKNLVFLSGHSAGAYLDLMVTLDKKRLAKYDLDPNQFAGVISLSAQTITHFTRRQELKLKDTHPLVDEYAPLYFVRADAPPLLLITGDRELEMLGRYEENAYLARMMKLNGHKKTVLYELDGYGHNMTEPAFPLLIKEVKTLTKEIIGK